MAGSISNGQEEKTIPIKKSALPAPPLPEDWEPPDCLFVERLAQLHRQLDQKRVCEGAGGGLVKIEMNGMMKVLRRQLAPELVERKDRELLEDLLVSACNEAVEKARDQMSALLPVLLGETEDAELLEEADLMTLAKLFGENKGLLDELGDPLITAFMEMLAAWEEEADRDLPPKRRS